MKNRGSSLSHPSYLFSVFFLLLSLGSLALCPRFLAAQVGSGAAPKAASSVSPLSAAWLAEVEPLITPRERETFLALADDAAREAFVRRFWEVRDPFPQTARNEAEEGWGTRLAEARRRFGSLADPRARALLLAGEPARSFTGSCPGGPPLEVWFYERTPRLESQLPLFFLAGPAGGPPRLFRRAGGEQLAGINRELVAGCEPGEDLRTMHLWMRLIGSSYDGMVGRALSPPPAPAEDWLASFAPVSTDVPSGAPALDGDLAVAFPGRASGGTLVRGVITVPSEEEDAPAAAPAPRGAVRRIRDFLLTGQVLRSRQILETFRYVFRIATPARGGAPGRVPLAFERQLPPGQYTLVVRLQDLGEGRFFRGEREVDVPPLAGPAGGKEGQALAAATPQAAPAAGPSPQVALPAAFDPGLDGVVPAVPSDPFAEATAGLGGEEGPSVRLLAPHSQFLVGETRFAASATPGVDRVAFLLDGQRLLTRNRAPFEVRLDLGPSPRPHTVEAEGLDAAGNTVARDRLEVNTGAERFTVRLSEPQVGRGYGQSLRAVADVRLPSGRSLDRLELYWNEERVATLYQPPWTLPVALPAPGAVGYVRAVAYLPDGVTAEDVVQVNTPGFGTEVEVRLVELYAAVFDRAGRPVEGLAGEQFQVQEDGAPQRVRRFERVRDLPLAAGLLLDTSGSMGPVLPRVREAAETFLSTLTPRDRAALLTFNRGPRLEVPLTGERAALTAGLSSLVAQSSTALYDSVIFGLRTLADAPGQRALLLLSDGEEQGSHFAFEQALEVARRSGVALYAIGLGARQSEAKKRLARLAGETGGRAFFPRDAAELAGIYGEIERELRSRYLLAYESSHGEAGRDFRRVEVQLAQPGLEARTISGYYP